MGCDLATGALVGCTEAFLLTHPVWDVTHYNTILNLNIIISTHTSRVGCDKLLVTWICCHLISTHTSRVGCDPFLPQSYIDNLISTHTSRVGCDTIIELKDLVYAISTHTSRVGCDQILLFLTSLPVDFYSHIPCGM